MRHLLLVPLLLPLLLHAPPAPACGPDTDCGVEGGTYRMDVPDGPDGDVRGALLFAHGYRGRAEGTMRNRGLRAATAERGVALVALQSGGADWQIPHTPEAMSGEGGRRDEVAYAERVAEAVAADLGIGRDRMVLAGFSAGAQFVWTMACEAPEAFPAFVPMSGTFWRPVPETCAGPATVRHFHGTADTTVPLAGRAMGDAVQGNHWAVLEMVRGLGFDAAAAPEAVAVNGLDCEGWTDGAHVLGLCLHGGGHRFDAAWVAAVVDDVLR